MNNNERGGIISNLILIPFGVALMAGFFLLGYYVGRYQSKPAAAANPTPLPDVVAKNLPKPEDFTFYKTLTEKDDKTVSIDLRPKAESSGKKSEHEPSSSAASPNAAPQQQTAHRENKKEPGNPPTVSADHAAVKELQKKKAPSEKAAATARLHYSLQIASYQEKQQADDDVRKMKQNGYAAYVVASDIPSKGTWYRVRLGSFSNKESAEKLRKELRSKVGIASIVVTE